MNNMLIMLAFFIATGILQIMYYMEHLRTYENGLFTINSHCIPVTTILSTSCSRKRENMDR